MSTTAAFFNKIGNDKTIATIVKKIINNTPVLGVEFRITLKNNKIRESLRGTIRKIGYPVHPAPKGSCLSCYFFFDHKGFVIQTRIAWV
jgi:hypothetical protein